MLIGSCAVRQAPPGGPEDKTPPSIVNIEPKPGTTAISPRSRFSITFSKPMDQEKTQGAIFLSPVFWEYPSFAWSTRKLSITPPSRLKLNTTYILTVGAGAVDYHGNKMGRSYSFAFSTGAFIDSGSISGAVFSEEGERAVYDIWAYSLDDTSGLDFWLRIPDHATQVDSTGAFNIANLGNRGYFVIAIDDKNDDLFWDPTSESIGLPPFIVKLTHEQRYRGIILRPARRDTSQAYISKAIPLDRQKLAVEFSQEPQKSMMLGANSYEIEYAESDSTLAILGLYQGDSGRLVLETDPQVDGRPYRLLPIGLLTVWGVPFDTVGGRFKGISTPDTIGPKLYSAFPPGGTRDVYQDSVVELAFSERVKAQHFSEAVRVVADSTDTLKFIPAFVAPNLVRLRFPGRVPRERMVTVTLFPKNIVDPFNNPMPDSVLSFAFRLAPADTVGTAAAEIANKNTAPIIGILTQWGSRNVVYKSNPSKSVEIKWASIFPGDYRLEFFEDTDGNGEWSPGIVSPFKPAERFSFLPDTLKVRSRWVTDIGAVSLPEVEQ
jgi:hypothetical protein